MYTPICQPHPAPALPVLSPEDAALVSQYLAAGEDLAAIADSPSPDPALPTSLALIAWLRRPDIAAWIAAHHDQRAAHIRRRTTDALLTLLSSPIDPAELRRIATLLLAPPRPATSPSPDRAKVPRPFSTPRRAQPSPDSEALHVAPDSPTAPAPPPFLAEETLGCNHDPHAPLETLRAALLSPTQFPRAPEVDPAAERNPELPAVPSISDTLSSALAALGIDPRILDHDHDLDDELDDAALDADADDLLDHDDNTNNDPDRAPLDTDRDPADADLHPALHHARDTAADQSVLAADSALATPGCRPALTPPPWPSPPPECPLLSPCIDSS